MQKKQNSPPTHVKAFRKIGKMGGILIVIYSNYRIPIQFSRSVVSDSLRSHESQHSRPPCPSPTPGVYSNSCSSSWWCHPAILSSIIPFSSCHNLSQHQSLFQHRSSKASILQCSAVFMVQLSHPYVTTGKNHSFD